MQLGFVLDQTRCIGCHACTIACKSENSVPVDSFRTWVKYTEEGEFPTVKRSFAVLRCNQCTAAPCVTICPTSALEKRAQDGIVDVNPAACIGCKSCMQGCPYDALYINPDKGTAEKCHFCAHRTEQGLAPACAVVCPTEAIIPGDFDDPESMVSRMKREFELSARKAEAGTKPNVLYRGVSQAGIDPLATNAAGGSIWSDRREGPQLEAAEFEALERKARARTTYDVAHLPLWGGKITGYLFAKSLAAGVFLAALVMGAAPFGGSGTLPAAIGLPLAGIAFLALTSLLLVLDLKRPERFLFILTRPNWSSWLVRGTWALISYGGLLGLWLFLGLLDAAPTGAWRWLLALPTAAAAGLSACYTGWLFGQAKGRVLWMRRGLWLHLIVQAGLAGTATILLLDAVLPLIPETAAYASAARLALVGWLVFHLGFTLAEGRLAPKNRQAEFARAHDLIERGPYSRRHWYLGVGVGIALPLVLALVPVPALLFVAALAVLIGLYVEEDLLVRAGQALSIS